jgi:hypothetical protein
MLAIGHSPAPDVSGALSAMIVRVAERSESAVVSGKRSRAPMPAGKFSVLNDAAVMQAVRARVRLVCGV